MAHRKDSEGRGMVRALCLAVLVFSLHACSGAVPQGVPAGAGETGAIIPQKEYLIQVGDTLEIKFFYNPELNEQVLVRPDGRISLQLAHEVLAAGKTPAQLRHALMDLYERELQTPEIAVIIRALASQRVFVDGEVGKPGIVPLAGTMTILQALAAAGGAKETASLQDVVVIRRGADNRPMAFKLDVESAAKGGDMSQDAVLVGSDIVVVPRSSIANVNRFVDLYIRRNIPVVTTFGYTYYANQ